MCLKEFRESGISGKICNMGDVRNNVNKCHTGEEGRGSKPSKNCDVLYEWPQIETWAVEAEGDSDGGKPSQIMLLKIDGSRYCPTYSQFQGNDAKS